MATKKKLLQAAAGQAGGEALNVEDVFSTYLYTGTGSAQTITNGLDLAGEGGLVWHKARGSATNLDHSLFDSETSTGATFPSIQKAWESNVAGSLATRTAWTFNSDGFTTTASDGSNGTDQSGINYVTWSFRKCPKFFDVVNYTGNSTSGRTISHNLGVVPAMIIVLGQNTGDYWVYHKDVGNTKYLELNKTTEAQTNSGAWNNTTPTDSVFTVGNGVPVNYSGGKYTAYLFAHNDGDGEFGPDGDADIIKCGSYTGNGSTDGPDIDLGFEPQWVMLKNASTGNSFTTWNMYDNMRGVATGGYDARLFANSSESEYANIDTLRFNADGFSVEGSTSDQVNKSGDTYIYIAIRRGPMAVPEDATDVFDVSEVNATFITDVNVGFPVDAQIAKATSQTSNHQVVDRMRGVRTGISYASKKLYTNDNGSERTDSNAAIFWDQTGFSIPGEWANINTVFYNWRRAPNYFDVVAYTGTGVNGTSVSHNLAYSPEMIWVKRRDSTADWFVYHTGLTSNYYLNLNSTAAETFGVRINTPTSTTFNVGSNLGVNASGGTYIAYLFASLDGVSKVGSYTGTGTGGNQIDCGFTSGARFVLIKRTDQAGWNWILFDSVRGIVAGNDPFLALNDTSAEVTSLDLIDPYSAGFELASNAGGTNASGGSYIFYAIA